VSLIAGRAGDLGVLLSLNCVFVTLHVVVVAVMAPRRRDATWLRSRGDLPFCVCLVGHLGLPLSGNFLRLLAPSIVFAASAFVVFNEWN
jgi:hypothetical protein